VAAAMRERGLPADWIDSGDLILTDENYGNANPIFEAGFFHSKDARLPIIPGFTGKSKCGNITTLGRGGSDTSAAIMGALLRSKEIQIWTDVSGMYSADPRHIPEATMIPHLSFDEALELAHFGAKVIHPRAVAIAKQYGIPLRILNAFHPTHPGTLLDEKGSGRPVHALAVEKELTVVPFTTMQSNNPPLLIYSGSADGSVRAVMREKSSSNRVALITIVSTALANTASTLSRLYDVLASASIRILAAVHGSNAHNLSLVVNESDVDVAARVIHATLIQSNLRRNITVL
jgi:aspartate kinase